MMKNRPLPDTFMLEINIYKPFEMNDMDLFPNRKLPKAISFYSVPDDLSILKTVPAVGEKPNVPPKTVAFPVIGYRVF